MHNDPKRRRPKLNFACGYYSAGVFTIQSRDINQQHRSYSFPRGAHCARIDVLNMTPRRN